MEQERFGQPSMNLAAAPPALQRAPVVGFLVVLVANLAVSFFILQQIQAHGAYPYDRDEANHANGGLALLLGFNAGGPVGLLQAFLQQGFYPPAFALVQFLAYTMQGPSVIVSRVCSVLALFLAIPLIYAICLKLDRRHGWLAGLIACGATLTVEPLLINAALVMKETPGLLVSMLFVYLYLGTFTRVTSRRLALAGGALLLVFLTKYTYGVAALGSAILLELSLLLWQGEGAASGLPRARPSLPARLRRLLWFFGPFLLGLALWFASPGNASLFLDYVTAQPQGAYSLTAESLLFYPRSIVRSQTPGSLFSVLTVLSLLWALRQRRNAGVRLLLFIFLVGVVMMTFNRPQNPRFIATFMPAAHILTGLMVARLARSRAPLPWLPHVARPAMGLAVAAIIAFSMPDVVERFRQYPARLTVAYETDPALSELAAWIQTQVPPGRRFYIVNYWDQFGPQTLAWHLGKAALAANHQPRFSDVLMPSALLAPASPQRVQDFRRELVDSGATHLVVLEGGPWGSPFWPEYTAALADGLQHAGETVMTVAQPVAPGQRHTLTIKAIVYRWQAGS